MHIAVDCRSVHPHMKGIGRASLDLVRAMGEQRRDHRVTMIVAGDRAAQFAVKGVHLLPVDGAMIDEHFDQFLLPAVLEQLAPDVYLNTTFSVPAIKTTRIQVSIIHDVVFEDRPEYVEPNLRQHLRRWSRFAAGHADHVVTVSDHARARILEVYGTEPSRVTRIYNGLSPECFERPRQAEIDQVRSKYSLAAPFLLYLGSIEVKKGIPELLCGYRRALDAGLSEALVLVGGKGGPAFDLESEIHKAGLGDQVRDLGFVDEREKKSLLGSSSLFVYPSLYEGFGLPPLEAMALGVPTLVSDQTSLPEVVGGDALVTPVHDREVFAKALIRGVRDQVFRQRIQVEGPKRARSYNWEHSANQVLDLCERLGEN